MKITTNFSDYLDFDEVDEQSLKSLIISKYPKIKKPIYINIDQKLITSYGLYNALYLYNFKRYSKFWTYDFIEEVEKHKGDFHRITLSYSFLYNAFHDKSLSKVETKYPNNALNAGFGWNWMSNLGISGGIHFISIVGEGPTHTYSIASDTTFDKDKASYETQIEEIVPNSTLHLNLGYNFNF